WHGATRTHAGCAITPLSLCLDRRVLLHRHRSRPAGSITPPRVFRGQWLYHRGTGRWNGPLRRALTRMVPAVSPPPCQTRIARGRGSPVTALPFPPPGGVSARTCDAPTGPFRPPGPARGFATDSEQARTRNS